MMTKSAILSAWLAPALFVTSISALGASRSYDIACDVGPSGTLSLRRPPGAESYTLRVKGKQYERDTDSFSEVDLVHIPHLTHDETDEIISFHDRDDAFLLKLYRHKAAPVFLKPEAQKIQGFSRLSTPSARYSKAVECIVTTLKP